VNAFRNCLGGRAANHSARLCQRQPRDVVRQIGRRGTTIDGAHEFDTRHHRGRLLAVSGVRDHCEPRMDIGRLNMC
jgi:hypothetical protein